MTSNSNPKLATIWHEIDVVALVSLEQLDANLFRCRVNQRNVNGFLYGGQIISQALAAASGTIADGRLSNSLHGYFLRGGNSEEPVIFEVERTRDGRAFSTRRVTALQQGEPILHMECSFHTPEDGPAHMQPAPLDVLPPEELLGLGELYRDRPGAVPRFIVERFSRPGPIEVRPADPEEAFTQLAQPRRRAWMRIPSAAGCDDPVVQQHVLTYLSDFWLSGVGLAAHTDPVTGYDYFIASVDHAVWFHRPARLDDWLLYDTESPFAANGTGLARGSLYDRAGNLVATVTQEAVFRQRKS